ncbi:hypothetical protein [Photobacterium damselae]
MRKFIYILLFFSSYTFAVTPLTWQNPSMGGANTGLVPINNWNTLPIGTRYIFSLVYRPTGPQYDNTYNIDGLTGYSVTTRLINATGFDLSHVVMEIPMKQAFPYAVNGAGNVKVYKVTDHIGVMFSVSIASIDRQVWAQDANSTFNGLRAQGARVEDDVGAGLRVAFVKLANFSRDQQFKGVDIHRNISVQLQLIGPSSTITAPPIYASYSLQLQAQTCGITLLVMIILILVL